MDLTSRKSFIFPNAILSLEANLTITTTTTTKTTELLLPFPRVMAFLKKGWLEISSFEFLYSNI